MYSMLKLKNEGLKEALFGFAQELVRKPSVSLRERQLADMVEEQMKAVKFDKVVRDDYGNVVGIIFGHEGEPTVLLNSHMDTVTAGNKKRWSESPYSGRIEDGKLYGLGAADCKGGLAAQVFAGALLKRSLLPLRGNLVVAATVAEENGRSMGVRGLLEHTLPELGMMPDYAILAEPTGLGLYYGHDGWMEIEVRVEGTNPFMVDDAARSVYEELRSGAGNGHAAGEPQMATVHPPRFTDLSASRRATIRLGRRLVPNQSLRDVLSQTQHTACLVAQPAASVAVEARVREESQETYTGRTIVTKHVTNAWSTDPFHPLMTGARGALAAAGCQVRPGTWQLGRLGMGTAGGVMVNEFDVPTIGYGPGNEAQTHEANEYVELDKVTETVYGTAAIVQHLVGIPVIGWSSDDI